MTRLFDEYQAAQAKLAREVTDGVMEMYGALDLARVDASAPGWLAATSAVVQRGHAKGVQLGSQFAEQFSDEGIISGRFRVNPATSDVTSIVQSLTVLGPYRAKHLLSGGSDFATVSKDVFAAVSGASVRHSLDGLRTTVRQSTYTRVRRVAGPGCCGFCAMLATREYWIKPDEDPETSAAAVVVGRRGRSRGNQPLGEKFHDHCKCEVVPVSDELQPDGYEDRLEKFETAYYEARERAAERPGGAAVAKNVISEMDKLQREGWF